MREIVVLGGGFAGAWAAAGVVRGLHQAGEAGRAGEVGASDVRVTLVDGGDDLVIRPRLYEADPERMRVPLDRMLGPIGVRRVAATVTGIDTAGRRVEAVGRDGGAVRLPYDRLVLATGSAVVRPDLPGAEHLFDVDTLPAAARLASHLQGLARTPAASPGRDTAVVVGAGFTGIEVATELAGRLADVAGARAVRVVLVEQADVVGPELGAGPRPRIVEALEGTGVETRLGTAVAEIDPDGVTLDDGTRIASRTVVWTAGIRASALTAEVPGERDATGRLRVDQYLRVIGVPGVYAAGDTAAALADPEHHVMPSCQHAVPQGKHVGATVAADLLGRDPVPFAPDPYVTCLDLGGHGAVFTTGWDREVARTGREAKELKRSINTEWIYPPLDDAGEILRQADHRTTWPAAG